MAAGFTGFNMQGEVVEGHVPRCLTISNARPAPLLTTGG